MPNGVCAVSDEIAYVEPFPGGSDSGRCTLTLPCATIAKALTTLITGRVFVKLSGILNEQVTIMNQDVVFHAEPGTRLTSASTGTLLRVEGTSRVSISDLQISGAVGATSGFGILANSGTSTSISLTRVKLSDNQAGGLSAIGSALTVSQSTIADNAGGGISFMNGTFLIVGNVFFNNGSDTASFGGISIVAPQAGVNRLELNSFNSNRAQATIGAGVHCVVGTFTARNNIISANGSPTNPAQIGGSCAHAYSIVRPGTVPPGPGNLAVDPLFKDAASGDLHLKPGSPASRAADPGSDLTGIAARDIDGDRRSAPATIGADELP
ncbi:MAG TPA: right-handed parallel beta-helix repeat-containing protein [Kofleriaceae bacterium]|nr:right-handed parallel beta-helix repeat-containing protein [Kofleriaceae bacterium]